MNKLILSAAISLLVMAVVYLFLKLTTIESKVKSLESSSAIAPDDADLMAMGLDAPFPSVDEAMIGFYGPSTAPSNACRRDGVCEIEDDSDSDDEGVCEEEDGEEEDDEDAQEDGEEEDREEDEEAHRMEDEEDEEDETLTEELPAELPAEVPAELPIEVPAELPAEVRITEPLAEPEQPHIAIELQPSKAAPRKRPPRPRQSRSAAAA